MKYLPFLTGSYSTAPGLIPLTKGEGKDKLIFQIDDTYEHYINNKSVGRKENIYKYFLKHELRDTTISTVNRFMVNQLVSEYPNLFELIQEGERIELLNQRTGEKLSWGRDWQTFGGDRYVDLFDALCSQVQEDLAVFQLEESNDYLSAIHLCSPNHWAPSDKIGKPFSAIHAPVPSMERTLVHYRRMLESIVHSSFPSTRFAWGIATDTRLNHHPEAPPGVDRIEWQGRHHDVNTTWYIRSERQNLVGFPQVNAFLFTIRTYFYSVDELSQHEKEMLSSAIKSMSPDTLKYKGLTESFGLLENKLKGPKLI
ncbi:MAG TPA: DUF3445 domain-containing protein [Cyclobacteriaceae bacterium]|nr:DUF3445 domain-containing protein [Cyclobacteriaceae bacterium]